MCTIVSLTITWVTINTVEQYKGLSLLRAWWIWSESFFYPFCHETAIYLKIMKTMVSLAKFKSVSSKWRLMVRQVSLFSIPLDHDIVTYYINYEDYLVRFKFRLQVKIDGLKFQTSLRFSGFRRISWGPTVASCSTRCHGGSSSSGGPRQGLEMQ